MRMDDQVDAKPLVPNLKTRTLNLKPWNLNHEASLDNFFARTR